MNTTSRLPFAALFAAALSFTTLPAAAQAEDGQTNELNANFDSAFGTDMREPQSFEAVYKEGFERRIVELADGDRGRIGVYAIDLGTGKEISVLGDQRFPMASTSKVAVAAAFLDGVDQGKWKLSDEFPLMIPVKSKKYSSTRAPVRTGNYVPAWELISLMISKSCNSCTDALLRVVGGPEAVNDWMGNAGFQDFQLSRDIATLVRDDGEYDPVEWIDPRDSASPRTMGLLVAGIYQGRWLSPQSRGLLMAALEETTTGRNRMNAVLPDSAQLAHKTGTLSRTASDIGVFRLPDGRAVAAAIYVTGQSANLVDEARNKRTARKMRDARIAEITRALYNGFAANAQQDQPNWTSAPRSGG
ncbi:serine hydrolase [Erythrobacter crassostreae]|uniref:beta-lactamase n=1 Tax=Erythrobacter crassostreae TaxID=2828328 RepID=A0A9X1JM25_9SPHN|nr:serine hydrolase [Erythrobacter crassostrea]MBV7258338.1 serine hydrolase [Erythrobacter crassostrea]